jgi:hypothetical protein
MHRIVDQEGLVAVLNCAVDDLVSRAWLVSPRSFSAVNGVPSMPALESKRPKVLTLPQKKPPISAKWSLIGLAMGSGGGGE